MRCHQSSAQRFIGWVPCCMPAAAGCRSVRIPAAAADCSCAAAARRQPYHDGTLGEGWTWFVQKEQRTPQVSQGGWSVLLPGVAGGACLPMDNSNGLSWHNDTIPCPVPSSLQ